MTRFWAFVVMLMMASNCETLDLDTIIREILGFTKEQLEKYQEDYAASDFVSLLLDNNPNDGVVKLLYNSSEETEYKFRYPRYKEAYRYLTGKKGRRFIDDMLLRFYMVHRYDHESRLKQNIQRDFAELDPIDRETILERTTFDVKVFLLARGRQDVGFDRIVREVTGYTRKTLKEFIDGKHKVLSEFRFPRYKQAYRYLSKDGRSFIDEVLTCYYLEIRGIFTPDKLKTSILRGFGMLNTLDRDVILRATTPDVWDFLQTYGRDFVQFKRIVEDFTGYTQYTLNEIMNGEHYTLLSKLQLELRTPRYEEAIRYLDERKARTYMDEVITCFYLKTRAIFTPAKLKRSIIGEFDKLNNSDQSIILGRTSYDVDEFFRTRGVHDADFDTIVREVIGSTQETLEEYVKEPSTSDIPPSALEKAYSGLDDKKGRRFISLVFTCSRVNRRKNYSEDELKQSLLKEFIKIGGRNWQVVLQRVSEEVKKFLISKAT